MPSQIFVSYAREDEPRVRLLVEALERCGWSVFWDRRIPAGREWRTYIGQALLDARCIIVAWSKHSIASSYIIEEAQAGKDRGILVPVRFDSVAPPFGFGTVNAADLVGWTGERSQVLEQFIGDVASLLGTRQADAVASRDAATSTPARPTSAPVDRAGHAARVFRLGLAVAAGVAATIASTSLVRNCRGASGQASGPGETTGSLATGVTAASVERSATAFDEHERRSEPGAGRAGRDEAMAATSRRGEEPPSRPAPVVKTPRPLTRPPRLPAWVKQPLPGIVDEAALSTRTCDGKNPGAEPVRRSCAEGDVGACSLLGNCVHNGYGVASDRVRAAELFEFACAKDAQYCTDLAIDYEHGVGVSRDLAKANQLYLEACDAGEVTSCFLMAMKYSDGSDGVPKQLDRARALFKRACDRGDEMACDQLKRLRLDSPP